VLLVKTTLGASAIEGIGLFAAEPIARGTPTWRFMKGWDQTFSRTQIDGLPEPARSEMLKYVYWNEAARAYVYCLDNARFMNHTADPNTRGITPDGDPFGYDIAIRDIRSGEELTCDYREFDGDFAAKFSQR
jgi:hypothetical protein